jgi:hypothetical protein
MRRSTSPLADPTADALGRPGRRSPPSSFRPAPRRGLAPLELTLTLPLLLMVMALMVILGAAGAWKLRTLANSRQAILRAISPRTTDNDPHPPNWWPAATVMQYHANVPSPFPGDPYVEHRVVRGPTIADPRTGNSLRVLIRTLDMREGMHSGRAAVDHAPAMWPRLGVRNAFSRETVMFAGRTWQYGNMGLPSNGTRRILHTYDYEMSRYNPGAAAMVNLAAAALLANPYRPQLEVLDQDAELRAWYGRNIDFHPQPPAACTNDPTVLRNQVLRPLLQRIDNVPRTMAETFLRMYQEQLAALENQNPPPPDLATQRAALLQKIRQLEDFLSTL